MTNQLRRLIAEQSVDDQTDTIPETTRLGDRTVTIEVPVESERDRSYPPKFHKDNEYDMVLLEGGCGWDGSEHRAFDRGDAVCPICEGRKLGRNELCLCCGKSGRDRYTVFPGLPVGKYIREDWKDAESEKPTPTKYEPGTLKGGLS